MKSVLGWVSRRGIVYLLLVAGVLAALNHQRLESGFRAELAGPQVLSDRAAVLDYAAQDIERRRGGLEKQLNAARRLIAAKPLKSLQKEKARAEQKREKLLKAQPTQWRQAISAATLSGNDIVANFERDLKIRALDQEIAWIDAAIEAAKAARSRKLAARDAQKALKACSTALRAIPAYDNAWGKELSGVRRELGWSRSELEMQAREKCSDAKAKAEAWRNAEKRRKSLLLGEARLQGNAQEIADEASRLSTLAVNTWAARVETIWHEWQVEKALWAALSTLLLIIATPLLIRLFFWFVLAPLAERRGAIRLDVPGGGAIIQPAGPSRTSVSVRLETGEELLVRQSYLQMTGVAGRKSTQWLLDWCNPLSSMASGMWFLTRIRGSGEETTVSATADPFAELTVLTLPAGSACALHPRVLAAVVQPIGRTMRIRASWRLFSLNAWLTMQLRYLVFYGPARLVIKGARGVRVEQAAKARMFGQDQLVGFSSDLAYSVTRTETLAPYLFGRERLFKDKVEAGDGIVIIEETPLLGGKWGGEGRPRGGLEGAFDALLKPFGWS